jgi:hypothetical protein
MKTRDKNQEMKQGMKQDIKQDVRARYENQRVKQSMNKE